MTLTDLKALTISIVKDYYTTCVIYPEYPIWKQANIIRAGGTDLTTMSALIDGKVSDIDDIEGYINALSVTDMWDNFVDGSDSSLAAYAVSYLASLDTTEKKMAVATSIRRVKNLFRV